jgi:hypothetical protein
MSTVGTKIVTISFVNQPKQPGGKKGTIKTKDNEIYGVWADKLANFQPGKTYEIKFEESEYNGKTYRTVTNWTEKTAEQPPAGNGSGNGNGGQQYYRPTSPVDAERMFVTSLVNAGVQAGKVNFSGVEIAAAVNAAREAWQQTFGAGQAEEPF